MAYLPVDIFVIPVPSVKGEARLKGRGWGVAGAGRSPIRKPGRNCAPGASLGEVGEPRVIGSDPTEKTGAYRQVLTNLSSWTSCGFLVHLFNLVLETTCGLGKFKVFTI